MLVLVKESNPQKTLFSLIVYEMPWRRSCALRPAPPWRLLYLDESGVCAGSEPSYTYYQRGEQKHLEQTLRRGRRLSIIGFLQPSISFVYGLVIGGVKRKYYIQMMEQEAQEAEQAGRMRVIVQDNSPIHRCQEVQQLWEKWESQGLYVFFLPKYCSPYESN